MKYNFKQETETAKIPTRHTAVSAGVDFYADEEVIIRPGKSGIVSTGISWNPVMWDLEGTTPEFDLILSIANIFKLALIIQSRSGYAFKHGIEASNAGVIDQDYVSTEENKAIIKVKLYNHSQMGFTVQKGDKICQGVPQLIPYFSDVATLDDTRNGKGFGSSDEKESKITPDCFKCAFYDECSGYPKLPRRVNCLGTISRTGFEMHERFKKRHYCPYCCTKVILTNDHIQCSSCNTVLHPNELVTIKTFMDKK